MIIYDDMIMRVSKQLSYWNNKVIFGLKNAYRLTFSWFKRNYSLLCSLREMCIKVVFLNFLMRVLDNDFQGENLLKFKTSNRFSSRQYHARKQSVSSFNVYGPASIIVGVPAFEISWPTTRFCYQYQYWNTPNSSALALKPRSIW